MRSSAATTTVSPSLSLLFREFHPLRELVAVLPLTPTSSRISSKETPSPKSCRLWVSGVGARFRFAAAG